MVRPSRHWQVRLQESWQRRSPWLAALLPLSWLFAALSAARRGLYRLRILRPKSLPRPVLVVGNLIAGGAGKTPTVMALACALRELGWKVGVISRGHGRKGREPAQVHPESLAHEVGDEPLLIQRRTGCPVVVGRDRVAAGMVLLKSHPEVQLILSDDGLQHLALARQAEVWIFDERGLGNGWLLPAGPLRERPARAGLEPQTLARMVLYNAPWQSTSLPGHLLLRHIEALTPLEDWHRAMSQGQSPQNAGENASLEPALTHLRGRTVLACAGIARPSRFFEALRALKLDLVECPLPDHHPFDTLPWPAYGATVVITEKDAVKIAAQRLHDAVQTDPAQEPTQVWVARLAFALPSAAMKELQGWLQRLGIPNSPT